MKTPAGLQPLIDDGVIDEVIRSLKSGKEATVYLVRSGAHMRCAKVYRNMAQRSFQRRARYQEGRKVRGSRQARAMVRRTRVRLLLPAGEARASDHGSRLTAAAHLAPLLISCTPLEAALRHVAIDLRTASVLPRAHHIHGRLLAALQGSDDFVNDAVIDQWL